MSALSDALGFVGSAISAPGDYTRGLLAGKPGERMGGRDLLRSYGLAGDDDNWGNYLGGMATDVLTDPLTYATMGMGSGAGSAAAKGVRGMIPLVAEDAAGAIGSGLGGAAKFKEPLRDVAQLANVGLLQPGESAAGQAGRAVSQLTGQGKFGAEMSGRTAAQMGSGDVRNRLASMSQMGLGDYLQGTGTSGAYNPDTKTIFSTAGQDASSAAKTLRHERIHAIIDNAGLQGNADQLPAMMRYPAQMKGSANPLVSGAGMVGDELAANALENRTLSGQLQGAAGFLFNPQKNAAYANQFAAAGVDPRVVGAYRYLPKGMVQAGGAAGATAAGGGNYLLQALLGGQE